MYDGESPKNKFVQYDLGERVCTRDVCLRLTTCDTAGEEVKEWRWPQKREGRTEGNESAVKRVENCLQGMRGKKSGDAMNTVF